MQKTQPSPKFILSALCTNEISKDPSHAFQIAWKINPYMKIGSSNLRLAFQEHDRFKEALKFAGAKISQVPFVQGAYDSVFMKDNALIIEKNKNKLAFLGTPKMRERQAEQIHRATALENLGVEVARQSKSFFEGGDLVVCAWHRLAFVGYGFRTDKAAAMELENFLGFEVQPLELVDPHFYHLDTVLNIIATPNGCVVLTCKKAFTEKSWKLLKSLPKIERVVEIPPHEAMQFGLNWVEVKDTVIIGSNVPTIAHALKKLGKHVVVTPLTQFQLAGGSAACLVAPVYDLDIPKSSQAQRNQSSFSNVPNEPQFV